MENEVTAEDFDGVFKFTNASKEDFTAMWNNVEYTYPAETRCPMVIPNEPAENIQNIRKRFALKYAQREFSKSVQGKAIEKEGQKHFMPATWNEKLLEPHIQQCLSPLPIASAVARRVPKVKTETIDGGTAVIGDASSIGSLSSSEGAFKDYTPPELGKMAG